VDKIDLANMEGADMLDVLHYYFEQDLVSSSSFESEARVKVRENLYRELYKTEYSYGYLLPGNPDTDGDTNNVVKLNSASGDRQIPFDVEPEDNLSDIEPFSPKRKSVKPFVPATNFNGESEVPFGNILDAPMN